MVIIYTVITYELWVKHVYSSLFNPLIFSSNEIRVLNIEHWTEKKIQSELRRAISYWLSRISERGVQIGVAYTDKSTVQSVKHFAETIVYKHSWTI